MDGKTVAIGGLVVLAVLLGGMVAGGLRPESTAQAQGGVYATYLATTVQVTQDAANFVILDTDTRRMIFYKVDLVKNELDIVAGKDLTKEFQRKGL